MKKTVFANSNVGGRGKSTVIKLIYENIIQKYNNSNVLKNFIELENIDKNNMSIISKKDDIRAIFEIDKVKIGIESQGDPKSQLPASIDMFIENQCDIIIVACRSSGETKQKVLSTESSGYRVIWIQNATNTEMKDILNKHYVDYFMQIFSEVFNELNSSRV